MSYKKKITIHTVLHFLLLLVLNSWVILTGVVWAFAAVADEGGFLVQTFTPFLASAINDINEVDGIVAIIAFIYLLGSVISIVVLSIGIIFGSVPLFVDFICMLAVLFSQKVAVYKIFLGLGIAEAILIYIWFWGSFRMIVGYAENLGSLMFVAVMGGTIVLAESVVGLIFNRKHKGSEFFGEKNEIEEFGKVMEMEK